MCIRDSLYQSPTLVARKRAGFHYFDFIADTTYILFIMSLKLISSLNDFLVKRMLDVFCYSYNDSFIHLVACDSTDASFSEVTIITHSLVPLYFLLLSSCSRIIVLTRAISLLTAPRR